MKKRDYKSFTEIDKEIQIVRLERDLHREKVLLHAEKLKSSFSSSSLFKSNCGGGEKESSTSFLMSILNVALPFILKKFKK